MSRAAEILKEVKPFIEEAVGVHVIIKGLRAARDLVSGLLSIGMSLMLGHQKDQGDCRHDRQV